LTKALREKTPVTVDQLLGSLNKLDLNRDGKDLSVVLSKSLGNGKLTIKKLLSVLEKEELDGKDQAQVLINTLKIVKKK